MNPQLRADVRRLRAESRFPLAIATAVRMARYERAEPPVGFEFLADIEDGPGTVSATIGDLDIVVSTDRDDTMSIGEDDVTGWFTDQFSEGCIPNTGGSRDGLKWYHPCADTLTNTYDNLRAAGMSKADAQARYQAIVEEEMTDDRERFYLTLSVSVSRDGVEVGSDSLSGIDSVARFNGVPYLIDTAHELISRILDSVPDADDSTTPDVVGFLVVTARHDEREPLIGFDADRAKATGRFDMWSASARSGDSVFLYQVGADGIHPIDSHDVPL